MSSHEQIYAVVRRIPRGRVASYGRIARMLGCGARQVGYALAAAPDNWGVPWWRVINSRGEISARKGGGGDARQRRKLLDEGVVFDARGRVDFARFGWRAAESPASADLLAAESAANLSPNSSTESAANPSPESSPESSPQTCPESPGAAVEARAHRRGR